MTRLFAAAVALFSVVALAAQPNPYLSQAKVFYQGLEYEKCLTRLDQATKWTSSEPAEEVEVQLYFGLCNFNIGNTDEAKRRFELALKLDPKLQLPPYTSPRIGQMFEQSREKIAARSKPPEVKTPVVDNKVEPVKPPEEKFAVADAPKKVELTPAPDTTERAEVVEPASDGPKILVPAVLGGTAVVATIAGAYLGVQAKAAEGEANATRFESVAFEATNRAQSNAMLANVAFAVAGAAVVGAVVTYFVTN